jgi:hypothetical protein
MFSTLVHSNHGRGTIRVLRKRTAACPPHLLFKMPHPVDTPRYSLSVDPGANSIFLPNPGWYRNVLGLRCLSQDSRWLVRAVGFTSTSLLVNIMVPSDRDTGPPGVLVGLYCTLTY